MKHTPRVLLAVCLWLALAIAAGQASPGDPPATTAQAGSSGAAPKGPVADNSRCFVCHGNYDLNDEKLALVHAQANIGCVRCHGESSPHSTDEDGLTPPDRIFPRSHIRFNCLGCHDWVKLVASDKTKQNRADLEEKPDHLAVLDGTAKEKKICTDCHGDHRLGYRTRKWDKRTRQLIYRDATPRMVPGSAASKPSSSEPKGDVGSGSAN